MDAKKITRSGKHGGFVHYQPVFNPVAKLPGANINIIGKPGNDLPVRPPPSCLQRLWQVPMVDGHPRLNLVLEAIIDNAVIKINSRPVNFANAVWQYPAP